MNDDWSHEEVEAVVADYFNMLTKELSRLPYNKAQHNRQLQKVLNNRGRGSVERKHQNISAILIEIGCPYIDGYKPLGNYQELLRKVVSERLAEAANLHQTISTAVNAQVDLLPSVGDILSIQVVPPKPDETEPRLYEKSESPNSPARRNYLELEARNSALGRAGEELVMQFEHERLWRAGLRRLAERIEHISRTQGDQCGYDILSFETNGRDRLIEVKTTRFGAMTPFFVSRNEVNISETRHDSYQLYRLFKFCKHPKLFLLPGSIRNSCKLEPISYSATTR